MLIFHFKLVKTCEKMFNFSSILEGKHEVVTDFPANYVLPGKKLIGDPLKTLTQCLNQVSTFLLVFGFDA